MEKLWTTSEAAAFLGVTEQDVEQLVREGKLNGYKLGGQFLRFRPSQVESLKGKIRFRPNAAAGKAGLRRPVSMAGKIREFVYFYDFYVVSAVLLLVLMVYLIAAS